MHINNYLKTFAKRHTLHSVSFMILKSSLLTGFINLLILSPSYASALNSSTSDLPALDLSTPSASVAETNAAAKPITSAYQARYKAKIKGFSATIERSLKTKDDGLWQLSNNATMFLASIKETSLFKMADSQVTPLNYLYSNALSSKHNSELDFDWKNLIARDSKKKNNSLTLSEHTFDKLSFQIQLRLDLIKEGSNFTDKSYNVIDKNRIKTYQVEKLGEEKLTTAAGTFATIKLKQYRPGKNKHTFIWLAKDWQYLILRLQRFENNSSGDSIELEKATLNGKRLQ